jgi:hypothetical protein
MKLLLAFSLLMLVQVIHPFPRIVSDNSTNQENHADHKPASKPNDSNGTIPFPVPSTNPDQKGRQTDTAKDKDNPVLVRVLPEVSVHKDRWDYIYIGASLLIALATFGIAIIAWTQAKAAYLNAQAVINSERPWLTVSLQEIPNNNGMFTFRITNKGRTLAKVISGTSDFIFAGNMDSLPKEPIYIRPFIYPYQSFLTQDEYFDVFPPFMPNVIINNRSITDKMFNPTQILFFYGQIIYEDVLGKDRPDGARHETRWCFGYDAAARFIRTGSAAYDEYT